MAEEKTTKKKTNSTTKKKVTKEETSTKKTTSKKTTPKKSNTASKTTSKKTPKKDVKETKKLEDTIRIRIDDDRVNDVESLDTSFIEGRKRKKVKEDSKEKEKILAEKKDYSKFFNIVKCIIYILAACCVIFLGVLALRKSDLFNKEIEPDDEIIEKEEEKDEEKDEEKVVLPDNYLFVGDFHTKGMDFEDFLYPFVKVSDLEYTTNDLLNNIEQDIYVYNPSAVFIQLGINDLNTEVEKEEIISNIEEIIKGIQSNRPYAKIYLESLYPIGEEIDEELELSEDITNKNIRNINAKLEKLADDLEVNYIDMYSELIDDNYLKESYTDDGFNLNEDGYKRVFKVINRIIEEADEKVK